MPLIQPSSLIPSSWHRVGSPTGKPAGPKLVLLQQAPPTGKPLGPSGSLLQQVPPTGKLKNSQGSTPTDNPHKVGLIRRRTVSIQTGQS